MPRRIAKLSLSMLIPCALLFGQASENPPYLDPDLPAAQRAADIVSRMTLEEKVLQMQNTAPAIPRLNIPAYEWWNEALHGVARAGQATVFPQAIGLAATWDTDLMFRIADVISTEARAKHHEAIRQDNHRRYFGLTFWSPNINIFRDPRWGRGQETYGEDPYLTGRLAVAFIRGLQGDDPRYYKTIATAKHYAVHSGPEPARHEFNVDPSERDLEETYLPAFRTAVVDGKVGSFMCAYNAVDGIPACANSELMQRVLKDEWGFDGYVVSDCGAIGDIYEGHKYKETAAEASALAVKTGTDLTCGDEYRSLTEAVAKNLITEAEIDTALERLFTARFRLGMFDPPERVPYASIPYSENDSAAHRKLALEAARKAIVLLKNDNDTLPLADSVGKIAVIGPSADDPVALLGNYNGISSELVTPLEGMRRQFGDRIRYVLGATYTDAFHALISPEALTPPSGTGHGLLAEYFANAELTGEPALSRVEPRPNFQYDMHDPAVDKAIPEQGHSVRWTGTLRAPFTGDFLIGARVGRSRGVSIQIYLDEEALFGERPVVGLGRVRQVSRQLEAGHDYKIRVEYRQEDRGGSAELTWVPPADRLLAGAIETVKAADVAVAFVGLNPNLEGEEMQVDVPGFVGGDRTDLDLPAIQSRLVADAIATGKPVVVVLTAGSALSVTHAAENAAAVLVAWYGGEEIGTAVAETLAGRNNPAGRLPVTFYQSVDQLPPFENYSMDNRTYRYFQGEPLYGFGYGLSYSEFQYSGLRAERTDFGATITVSVKNDSDRDGEEVVQLYASGSGEDEPVRELVGFERMRLGAGESRNVEFTVGADDLPQGIVRISVGGGQPVDGVAHVTATL